MSKRLDIIGKTFERLTVISFSHIENGYSYWNCNCSCGNAVITRGGNLTSGMIKSCGCLRKENNLKVHTKHGMCYSRLYKVWESMIRRCEKPKDKGYKYYGGRGIAVCKRWHTFENFYKDMGVPLHGLSIERINNEKGYFKNNCKWATKKEQANNRRKPMY